MSEEKGNEMNPMIEDLVEYMNSINYTQTIQVFFKNNCAGFEEYARFVKTGMGNKLEWTTIYHNYIELIEEQLEIFCKKNHINVNELFTSIQDYVSSNSNENEFIPIFLKATDENHFFEQMYLYSMENSLTQNAIEMSENEGKGEESMTGLFVLFCFVCSFVSLIVSG